MTTAETLLVTGASGLLGRLVLDTLVRSREKHVIATTRTPLSLVDYARDGIQVRAADFNRPQDLVGAFCGATVMLLISTHEVGARAGAQLAAIEAAKEAGVRHIVYTSHTNCDTSVSAVAPEHAITEKALLECGLKYTILRHSLYAEMLLEMLPAALEIGSIYGAAGDGRISYVTRRDLANADAAVMTHASAHENVVYDLTGQSTYSYADVARIVSGILGRRIPYVNLSFDDYRAMLLKHGFSDATADMFLTLERSNSLGELDLVTDMVQRLTGHAPETLEEFLRKNLYARDHTATMEFIRRRP